MAVQFGFLLIITGLTGVHSITTVSEISVKAGASITIPCLYDSRYINHVKYLCKGYYWASCKYVIKTNQPQSSRKFSISDNKTQRIFTVTIKDITDEDTYYWCAVEMNIRQYFQLSVSRGTSSLYVDHQQITGFNGDSITISCHNYNSGEIKWCRLGRSCVTGPSGSIDKTAVTINVSHNVFTVTMSRLSTESSGWYLCVKGNLQMPVHLTVIEKHTTTTVTSLPPKPDNTPINGNKVNNSQGSSRLYLKELLIPLGFLMFIVMVTLFIWFKLKKHKQSRVESSVTVKAEEEVTYCSVKHQRTSSDQDIIYCNSGYMRGTSGQVPYTEKDVDVIYSSAVFKKHTVKRAHKPRDQDVTYSTLMQHHQQI